MNNLEIIIEEYLAYCQNQKRLDRKTLKAYRIDLTQFMSPIDVAVLVMGDAQTTYAFNIVRELRDCGIATVSYLDANKKFKNQIEYADKIRAKFSIIIGEDEVKNNVVSLKNMTTGDQQTIGIADAIKIIQGK